MNGTQCRATPFQLALVGAGRMGATHLRALAGSTAISVTGVVEPDTVARQRLTAQGYVTREDLTGLLTAIRPDGLLIAAPTGAHAQLVRQAAQAGIPVLCEKPAGLGSPEVQAIEKLTAEHPIVFQVAYWRRFVPAVCRLQQRIAEGDFGEVHLVVASQWDQAPPSARFREGSGGIFVDMGVHEFDQIRWLTGQEVDNVHAVAAGYLSDSQVRGDVDSAQAMLTLSGGSTAVVSLGRHHAGGDLVTVEVFGTLRHERVTILDPTDGDGPFLDALRRQAEAFATSVRSASGTGDSAGSGLDDAVAALDCAERAAATLRIAHRPQEAS